MTEPIIVNKMIGGVAFRIEIPFGYIPVYDGPLKIGDKAYKIYDDEWQDVHINECKYDEARDYYLIIRPTVQ